MFLSKRRKASKSVAQTRRLPAHKGATGNTDEDQEKANEQEAKMKEAVDYVSEAIKAVEEAESRASGSACVPDLEAASEALVKAETTLEGEWGDEIIDAARTALTTEGSAIVVRHTLDGAETLGSVFFLADYGTYRQLCSVAAAQATRQRNKCDRGWNYYFVVRYTNDSFMIHGSNVSYPIQKES
jgi:hypothetical protein